MGADTSPSDAPLDGDSVGRTPSTTSSIGGHMTWWLQRRSIDFVAIRNTPTEERTTTFRTPPQPQSLCTCARPRPPSLPSPNQGWGAPNLSPRPASPAVVATAPHPIGESMHALSHTPHGHAWQPPQQVVYAGAPTPPVMHAYPPHGLAASPGRGCAPYPAMAQQPQQPQLATMHPLSMSSQGTSPSHGYGSHGCMEGIDPLGMSLISTTYSPGNTPNLPMRGHLGMLRIHPETAHAHAHAALAHHGVATTPSQAFPQPVATATMSPASSPALTAELDYLAAEEARLRAQQHQLHGEHERLRQRVQALELEDSLRIGVRTPTPPVQVVSPVATTPRNATPTSSAGGGLGGAAPCGDVEQEETRARMQISVTAFEERALLVQKLMFAQLEHQQGMSRTSSMSSFCGGGGFGGRRSIASSAASSAGSSAPNSARGGAPRRRATPCVRSNTESPQGRCPVDPCLPAAPFGEHPVLADLRGPMLCSAGPAVGDIPAAFPAVPRVMLTSHSMGELELAEQAAAHEGGGGNNSGNGKGNTVPYGRPLVEPQPPSPTGPGGGAVGGEGEGGPTAAAGDPRRGSVCASDADAALSSLASMAGISVDTVAITCTRVSTTSTTAAAATTTTPAPRGKSGSASNSSSDTGGGLVPTPPGAADGSGGAGGGAGKALEGQGSSLGRRGSFSPPRVDTTPIATSGGDAVPAAPDGTTASSTSSSATVPAPAPALPSAVAAVRGGARKRLSKATPPPASSIPQRRGSSPLTIDLGASHGQSGDGGTGTVDTNPVPALASFSASSASVSMRGNDAGAMAASQSQSNQGSRRRSSGFNSSTNTMPHAPGLDPMSLRRDETTTVGPFSGYAEDTSSSCAPEIDRSRRSIASTASLDPMYPAAGMRRRSTASVDPIEVVRAQLVQQEMLDHRSESSGRDTPPARRHSHESVGGISDADDLGFASPLHPAGFNDAASPPFCCASSPRSPFQGGLRHRLSTSSPPQSPTVARLFARSPRHSAALAPAAPEVPVLGDLTGKPAFGASFLSASGGAGTVGGSWRGRSLTASVGAGMPGGSPLRPPTSPLRRGQPQGRPGAGMAAARQKLKVASKNVGRTVHLVEKIEGRTKISAKPYGQHAVEKRPRGSAQDASLPRKADANATPAGVVVEVELDPTSKIAARFDHGCISKIRVVDNTTVLLPDVFEYTLDGLAVADQIRFAHYEQVSKTIIVDLEVTGSTNTDVRDTDTFADSCASSVQTFADYDYDFDSPVGIARSAGTAERPVTR